MSVASSLKSNLMNLANTPFRGLFAALATLGVSVRRGIPSLFYVDGDGDWINRQPGVTFVNPAYSSMPAERIFKELQDYWLYDYKISPGDTVIDIGAGVGDDAVFFSRLVGPTGRVFAIEANPRVYRCLEKTIKANSLTNVTALHLALSDHEGPIYIEDEYHHVANRVCEAGAEGRVEVRAATLDGLLSELGISYPHFIKMNVEGAETPILRAADRTLKSKAHWAVSCHDFTAHIPGHEGAATYADVTSLFARAGFEILPPRVDERPWVPFFVYARPRY